MSKNKLAIVCVADQKVKYLSQALRLIQSLRWFGGEIKKSDIFVGLFDENPTVYIEEYQRFGAKIRILKRYTDLHGPSNKMAILKLEELKKYDYVMLIDCDTIIVSDFTDYLNYSGIQAKISDLKTLSDTILQNLFLQSGQRVSSSRYTTSIDRENTLLYCNSGVIIFSQDYFSSFIERWFFWNNFMLARMELLERFTFFCDQASFALTINEFVKNFRELPLSMNYPSHFLKTRYPQSALSIQPKIIHYHHMVDSTTGYLINPKLPNLSQSINEFNQRIVEDRKLNFSNALFWDYRYEFNSVLGSGIGSRGDFLEYKVGLVRQFCLTYKVKTLIDYGCGDLSILKEIRFQKYIGIDISHTAIKKAKSIYPEYTFLELDLSTELKEIKVESEFSICFDVLIHQPNPSKYYQVLDNIMRLTQTAGLISGFDREPSYDSEILFFHEPLHDTLSRLYNLEIRKIGTYRQTIIYLWKKLK